METHKRLISSNTSRNPFLNRSFLYLLGHSWLQASIKQETKTVLQESLDERLSSSSTTMSRSFSIHSALKKILNDSLLWKQISIHNCLTFHYKFSQSYGHHSGNKNVLQETKYGRECLINSILYCLWETPLQWCISLFWLKLAVQKKDKSLQCRTPLRSYPLTLYPWPLTFDP